MSRISPVDPAKAEGKARDLLAAVHKALGVTPNVFRVAAQSPATLEGLLNLNGALAGGTLDAKIREAIALAVAQQNGCDYCLSAHVVLGKRAGLSEADITLARQGSASEGKAAAAVGLAKAVVQRRGMVSEGEIAEAGRAGLSEAEIVEVVGNVVVNIFTNYLNHVARTEVDFPVIRAAA
jgi:uncharacterized peroxidase-related enzyme